MLTRTGTVKKWLDTIKGETFTTENFSSFFGAFKSILSFSLSAESLRNLALYISYAIYNPQTKISLAVRSAKTVNQLAHNASQKTINLGVSSTLIGRQPGPSCELSRLQTALRILDLYSDLLCRANDTSNIKKFARTVTNKV